MLIVILMLVFPQAVFIGYSKCVSPRKINQSFKLLRFDLEIAIININLCVVLHVYNGLYRLVGAPGYSPVTCPPSRL